MMNAAQRARTAVAESAALTALSPCAGRTAAESFAAAVWALAVLDAS